MQLEIFKNIELNEALDKNGFVIIRNFINNDVAQRIEKYYLEEVPKTGAKTTQPNYLYCTPEQSHTISNFLVSTLKDSLDTQFSKCQFLGGVYISKPAGEEGVVKLHQDWNLVDESKFKSYNLWCPLTDVDEKNGALYILPNTHRLPFSIRAAQNPPLYLDFSEELKKFAMKIEMKKGDALLYENKLFHGSPPNKTDKERIAIVLGVIPAEAQFIYNYTKDPARLNWDMYKVDDDLYINHSFDLFTGKFPEDKYQSIGKFQYSVPPLTVDNLIAHCSEYAGAAKTVNKTSFWKKLTGVFAGN